MQEPHRLLRDLAKQEYENITCLEEIKWKQRAKVWWLKEGDKNTNFFQCVVSCRRNTNYIHSLTDEDRNELPSDQLKDHIVSYFMRLFKEPGIHRPKLNGIQFKRISANSRVWIERPFEEDEVKRVVWSINDDKAPGPNGFTMAFFK